MSDTPPSAAALSSTQGEPPKPEPKARLDCLVDGFNVYHSLDDARAELLRAGAPSPSTKWLDMRTLVEQHLFAVAGVGKVELQTLYYFTALAHHIEHRKPGVLARHTAYITALESTGVRVVHGRFKKANPKICPQCGTSIPRHEEKETDVSISVKLLELLVRDQADAIMIVSGDTDLIPAIKTARSLFPTKPVGCLFPFRRGNAELKQACTFHASIGKEQYAKHQLPDPIVIPGRRPIVKPATW